MFSHLFTLQLLPKDWSSNSFTLSSFRLSTWACDSYEQPNKRVWSVAVAALKMLRCRRESCELWGIKNLWFFDMCWEDLNMIMLTVDVDTNIHLSLAWFSELCHAGFFLLLTSVHFYFTQFVALRLPVCVPQPRAYCDAACDTTIFFQFNFNAFLPRFSFHTIVLFLLTIISQSLIPPNVLFFRLNVSILCSGSQFKFTTWSEHISFVTAKRDRGFFFLVWFVDNLTLVIN